MGLTLLDGLFYQIVLQKKTWSTWSSSANKFLQRIWNLNYQISIRKERKINTDLNRKFELSINSLTVKIDDTIENFRFNVSIAHFYEMYSFFWENLDTEISNKTLKYSLIKMMKLMIPFTPHLAQRLEFLSCIDFDNWPKIDRCVYLTKYQLWSK